jgi:hypothetical protein
LRIDVIIIKKDKDAVIDKNIASIFRGVNIVEYKSPDDSLTVADFHKVLAYAHLYYALQGGIGINDMTITLVAGKHPRELLKHLQKECYYKVEERWQGIYLVTGDKLPVQIIETKQLSDTDNMWLSSLSNKLTVESLSRIMEEGHGKVAHIAAFMYMVLHANVEVLEEIRMRNEKRFYQVLEQMGVAAEFEARGEARGEARAEARLLENNLKVAQKFIRKGWSVEEIAEMFELDIDMVRSLCKQ